MRFPSDYTGDYFFADYCSGWIRRLDPANGNTVTGFATGIASPVDLAVASDGSLYYLARGSGGAVFRVAYTASQAPSITTHPTSRTVSAGASTTFTVAASGTPPLSYQWQRNGVDIPGATASSYTLTSVTTADNGARFRARVTNASGSAVSNEATLTVTSNQPPAATIAQPPAGTLYSAGQSVAYAGSGSDPEDGTLPASAFTWQIDFHHAAHVHPFMAPTSGATSGSFVPSNVGHTEADVWYRIYLTVRDSGGLTTTVFRDVQPRSVQLTFATSPAGLSLRLDGQPRTTPLTVTGVVGVQRTLEAPSPQTVGGRTYEFVSWSDARCEQPHDLHPRVEHDLHGDLPRSAGADGRPDSDVLQQHRLHRRDRDARRRHGGLRLGLRRAGDRDRGRHVQHPLGGNRAATDQRHVHLLHRQR